MKTSRLPFLLLIGSAVLLGQDKVRVYVEPANDSWSATANRHFAQASTHPQTVELMKTLGHSCPNVVVTLNPEKADFKIFLERESNKLIRRDNKFAVFNKDGDMVFSASTRVLGNGVRNFCATVDEMPQTASEAKTESASPKATTAEESRPQPEWLRNKDIVALKNTGFADDLILQKIKSSPGLYNIGADDLMTLKRAGLPEPIIAAMIAAPTPR